MAEADFFSKATPAAVEEAVRAVEAATAAELVVAGRRQAARWPAVDLAVGMMAGFVTLLLLLFHPYEFPVTGMPVGVLVVGGLFWWLSSSLWGWKRLLLRRRRVDDVVAMAAKAAFVDLGVSRTTGRTGVLVAFFVLERRVELVVDVNVDPAPLASVHVQLQTAFDAFDFAAFVTALKALGPILGAQLPRSADDVNELPDAMVVDHAR